MERALYRTVQNAIESRIIPGCVIGVITENTKKECFKFGRLTYDKSSPEITEKSMYDVASITKAVPTACLALKALELGKIALDDAVIQWIPELNNACKNEVRVKHLLTHTLDFDFRLSGYKDLSPEKILETIYHADCKGFPGTRFNYCNSTAILLGIVVERVFGKRLDVLADNFFFEPLGMKCTTFYPEKMLVREIVPAEIDFWRGRTICGEIHDESAWVLRKIMIPGSAGLFSCAPDLLIFLEMLLNNGACKSKRCFKASTVQVMSTNHIAEIGESAALGWELNQRLYMGGYCSNRTIGKTGFTGCMLMADLEKGAGIVFLANHTWPRRKNDKESINKVRREIADIVFRYYGG